MPGKLEDLCYLAHHVKRASLMADIKLSLGLNYQPTPILLYFGGHYMRVELYFFLNKKSSKFYLQNTRLYVQFYLKSVEVALFSSRSRIYAAKSEKAGNKLGNKVMVVVKVQTSTRERRYLLNWWWYILLHVRRYLQAFTYYLCTSLWDLSEIVRYTLSKMFKAITLH